MLCASLAFPVWAQEGPNVSTADAQQPAAEPQGNATEVLQPQPKRILGIMPNFRAVSAGTLPPPPTRKEAFKIATQNSFDYSAFVFVGVTSALAEWSDAHPQLGEGMKGYGRYYWRGMLDKTDGNYLVIWALPSIFHQDERYYAMGKGHLLKRPGYAMSRVAITPDYDGIPASMHPNCWAGRWRKTFPSGITRARVEPPARSRADTHTPCCETAPPTHSAKSGRTSRCTYCIAIRNRGRGSI